MQDRQRNGTRTSSGPSLIAWLSLCLLAAAWGRTLDESLQVMWGQIGAFGLVAAVGLEAMHRARSSREHRVRERVTQKRVAHGLTRLAEESATLDAMNLALRKLVEDVARRKGPQQCASGWTKRHCEAEILRKYPLDIAVVTDSLDGSDSHDGIQLPLATPHTKGYIRQLSSNAIAFEHTEPLGGRVVMASFELARGERFSIVVDVLWTERDGDGYLSGGTVLAAGTPSELPAAAHAVA